MRSAMPRVSVIIPAFNAERHIAEALTSVQSQTYRDWEAIVADDCSTDATVEFATGFDGRVRIAQSAKNAGPAAARNLGVCHATGELLALLDADDYWEPAFLERLVSLYDASGGRAYGVGIVACNARVLGPDGFLPRTYMDYVEFPRAVTLERLLSSNPLFVSALTPQAIVEEVGGFCTDLFGTEDHDLWVRIVELGYRVIATREQLAVYRLGAGSVSSGPASMARASQSVYVRALARGKLTPPQKRIARRELRRHRAIEQISPTPAGVSYRQALRALPLLLLVAAEHPAKWRKLPGMVTRGRRALSPFGI
jgi:glycosyltransferase involved in cell wall biosynthesis